MIKFAFLLASLLLPGTTFAADSWYGFFDHTQKISHGIFRTDIQVGYFQARPTDKLNVVYLHGYADTMDNHENLITNLRSADARVFAFDFPGHGQSGGFISTWDLKDVAEIVKTYLNSDPLNSDNESKLNRALPLVLVGWSTGGTIAIRIAQSWKEDAIPDDLNLKGIVAFAPAVPSQLFVGDSAVFVEKDTLTRNPDAMKHEPKPKTTVRSVLFAKSIVAQGLIAKAKYFPETIAGLILVGGDEEDKYANAPSTVQWVRSHGAVSYLTGYQCAGAFHGLEFEPDGISEATISLARNFLRKLGSSDDRMFSPVFKTDYRDEFSKRSSCARIE